MVLRISGGCMAAPIPSTFGLHPNTPGVTYLDSPAALAATGQSEAVHLVQQLGGDPTARPWNRPDCVLLAPEQRRTLISLLDDTHWSELVCCRQERGCAGDCDCRSAGGTSRSGDSAIAHSIVWRACV